MPGARKHQVRVSISPVRVHTSRHASLPCLLQLVDVRLINCSLPSCTMKRAVVRDGADIGDIVDHRSLARICFSNAPCCSGVTSTRKREGDSLKSYAMSDGSWDAGASAPLTARCSRSICHTVRPASDISAAATAVHPRRDHGRNVPALDEWPHRVPSFMEACAICQPVARSSLGKSCANERYRLTSA